MASSNGLRQAGRHVRIIPASISSPVTRQNSSISSLIRKSTSRPKQLPRSFASNFSQQSRSFSLWGSGSTAKPEAPDVPVIEPASIETTRTIQASHATSDNPDPSITQSHSPSLVEPQIIEDIQSSIAEPHSSDPAAPVDLANIADVPERLGYLKEVCGLDFGWGPTSVMEWAVEYLHIVGGFSWATSCILLGIVFRASIAPLMVSAAKETAKLREMAPLTKPITDKMALARSAGDRQLSMQLQKELQMVRKEFGVKFYKAFLPVLVQLPFGFGAWRILRNAATLPVPGFVTETWLWTSDLSFSDPYFILPVLGGACIYLTLKTNKAANKTVAGVETQQQHFMTLMTKLMPFITTAFVAIQPGAVQLYIVSSSAVGAVTAVCLANSSFRSMFNLPPILKDPSPTPAPAAAAPLNSPTTQQKQPSVVQIGGLKRRQHTQAAKSAVAIETPQRNPNRSMVDKVVDAGKDQWSSIKANSKGMVAGLYSTSKEEAGKKHKQQERDKQQAQYRADFEASRKATEEKLLQSRQSSSTASSEYSKS